MRKTVFFSFILSLVLCMGVNAYTDENGRHCAGSIEELCEEVNYANETIVITNNITIDRPVKALNSCLLMVDESVKSGPILTIADGGELDGFDILV